MQMTSFLNPNERIMYTLRELYRSYGYAPYQVSKFEEYDFYVQNRNFLDCRRILAFSDTNGKLMALKPDVTLSIVKNLDPPAGQTQKVCYTENVYRAPNGGGFREIPQTGLECVGRIDHYAVSEVVLLAARSLQMISDRWALDLSHMGILSGLLAPCDEETRAQLLQLIAAKNTHDLTQVCRERGVAPETAELLRQLVELCGPLGPTLAKMPALPAASQAALEELHTLEELLTLHGLEGKIQLDLSIVNDMDYYNGIFFRGYVDGIPAAVLSGGQYDNLMAKMGRDCGAIGFAVYLDQLERFGKQRPDYDVDTLILYDDTSDPATMIATARSWTNMGKTISVQRTRGALRCRQVIQIRNREAIILETHD